MPDTRAPLPSAADRRCRLRAAVEQRAAVLAPGAGNALTARIIEDCGFDVVYVTGAGIANTALGVPDIGLVTMTELAQTVAAIGEVCALPLVVDIDTGFGNAINAHRTMRVIERAGAAAVQIEDQVFPKRCGHFAGKAVIPLDEMTAKIRAVADAREDAETLIIGRTDAAVVDGLDAALERAEAMIAAGADLTFVEAPRSEDELARIARLPVPQLANLVVGGKTPMLPRDRLAEMGFALVLYANAPLQAAMHAMHGVLTALHRDGDLSAVTDRLAGFEERQRLVGKPAFDALEARYRGG